jgi:hypothetical protein
MSTMVKEVMEALSKVFTINDLGEMKHFVGSHIINSKEGNTTWIHQPKLIKHPEEDFKQYITTERIYKTPAAPKKVTMRPQPGDPLISDADQSK